MFFLVRADFNQPTLLRKEVRDSINCRDSIKKTVGEFFWFFLHIKRVPSASDKMSYRTQIVN